MSKTISFTLGHFTTTNQLQWLQTHLEPEYALSVSLSSCHHNPKHRQHFTERDSIRHVKRLCLVEDNITIATIE